MKKVALRLLILAVVAGMVAGGYYLVSMIPQQESELATATVRRGDLVVKTYLRGELTTVRSMTVTAPNLGSISQITRLAPPGSLSKIGDLIAEFDDSERRVFLEDALLDAEQIRQNLKKAETDLEIRKSQDQVELVKAQFAVRRAELEVKRNELISAIDARKNVLTLEEARRRLQKLEQDIKSRLQQREAELAVLREQLNRAQLDVNREQRRIEQARILAPMSGLVSILENRSGRGGFGQTTPQIREGDQIPAGMAIAQILDLSDMDLMTKVEEVERASLSEGQEALIRLDALPGKVVHAKVRRLGNTATTNVFRGDATKKFECVLSVDMSELLQAVGASPEQIKRILATAKENSQRGISGSRPSQNGAGSGLPAAAAGGFSGAGGSVGGAAGFPGAGGASGAAEGASGERRRGFGQMTEEQREQIRQRMQQFTAGRDPSSLSQEERQKIFQQMRQSMGGASGGGRRAAAGGEEGAVPRGAAPAEGGGQAAGPAGMPVLSFARPGANQFTAEQRAKATLPAAAHEGSDVDILLRPGLLADAEIIVENIPNVVHIPYQAVFDQAGNPIVYARKNDRFEPRRVKLGQRSESQIVILEGLEEGEIIALESPDTSAQQDRAKKKKKSATGGESQPTFPGAGGPGGGGPR